MPTEKQMAEELKSILASGVSLESFSAFQRYRQQIIDTYGVGVFDNVLDLVSQEKATLEELIEELKSILPKEITLGDIFTNETWIRQRYELIDIYGAEMFAKAFEMTKEKSELEKELEELLNRHSIGDTPNYILAQYLLNCLEAWNVGVEARNEYYCPSEKKNAMFARFYGGKE